MVGLLSRTRKQASGGFARRCHRNAVARLSRFRDDEAGSMLVFGMYMFFLMWAFAGIAVDVMRHETLRTNLQNTVDRASLAAASLRQTLDPETVVLDYFAKAGLSEYVESVDPDSGLNFKSVSVTTKADMPTIFMNFMGIDELKLTSAGAATERITNVEISLVLDISGSMNSYNRLTNLKAAATEFVDTVLGGAEQDRITMSIIPYSGQVNLGKPLLDQFTVGQNHAYSYCLELVDSDFNSISLSTTSTRLHSAHFDPYDYANSSSDTGPNLMFCPYQSANTVMPFSDDADALKTKINGLIAGGNTSIDIGMKWGSLLLDTNAGDVVDGLIAQNVVKTAYSNRPLDPDNVDVLKVLVLMTDGENTTQYQIDDNYLTGTSNIWRRNSDGRLSVYHSSHYGSSDYYSPRDNAWYSSPVGGTSGATQLDWADVWNYASVDYVAYYLNSKPMSQSFSGWWNTFIDSNYSNKNSRLDSVCDAAKAEEIVVYGIALEAPYNGQQVIKSCASSPGHYFDVDGLEISTAFRAIASQISQLRLTQ